MPQRIYIGNLTRNIANQTIAEKFSKYGIVYSAKVDTEVDTDSSSAFAFVEMASSEEAQLAIKDLNGSVMDGRLIHVKEDIKTYLH